MLDARGPFRDPVRDEFRPAVATTRGTPAAPGQRASSPPAHGRADADGPARCPPFEVRGPVRGAPLARFCGTEAPRHRGAEDQAPEAPRHPRHRGPGTRGTEARAPEAPQAPRRRVWRGPGAPAQAAPIGVQVGNLAVRSSPDERPRTRRCSQGSTCSR
ncbi:hypothetical protein Asp14428_21380 [Actinoplanes sp. NBRC 14428]|nr:hypothetical protein Asp14428_21380 [Actinoplanes sp. NBRC 14428]